MKSDRSNGPLLLVWRLVARAFLCGLALLAPLRWICAQDAAPADRNAINTRARPGDMMADSPVTFPKEGALPARFPPDIREQSEPAEKDYYLFSTYEVDLTPTNRSDKPFKFVGVGGTFINLRKFDAKQK